LIDNAKVTAGMDEPLSDALLALGHSRPISPRRNDFEAFGFDGMRFVRAPGLRRSLASGASHYIIAGTRQLRAAFDPNGIRTAFCALRCVQYSPHLHVVRALRRPDLLLKPNNLYAILA